VLRKGIATGEEFVRILTGTTGQKAVGYPERADGNPTLRGTWLVNRQA
jgi:hypothetical protein